eukprot:TRINITY_DN5166_c0_g3_i1.p1 TRINITY_DN5166_c0_g3~~TRINITY_DN5166_c0_g3_i1.p1  ORF type:complete len:179 (+),score=43.41 TRINITY_DN5166_c0_g3_i1:638-1174(+)
MQLEEIKDASTILCKGINECKAKNYKDIMGIVRYIALSNRLLEIVTNRSICATFFGLIIKSQALLDAEGHIDALNAILNIYRSSSGRGQIIGNAAIVDYVRKSLVKENAEIARMAAEICVWFLKDGMVECVVGVENEVLRKFLPCIGVYSTLDTDQDREKCMEMIEELKKKRMIKNNY